MNISVYFCFFVVVTAENMSGAAMYELVSGNLSESKAFFTCKSLTTSEVKLCHVEPIVGCQYLYLHKLTHSNKA